jgi:hypothetical protein
MISTLKDITMIICKLTRFKLSPGETIINTSYEVSTNKDMTELLAFDYQNSVNKYSIIFDIVPEKGRTYYSRVAVTLNTGPTEWGPITEFTYKGDDVSLYHTLPSVISTPVLSTSFWETEHPHGCFTIDATPYNAIGDSSHKYSIWNIIDVLTGEVVFTKTTDVGLTSLYVDVMLDHNRIYNINLIYFGDNNDKSERGSLTIVTSSELIKDFRLSSVSSAEDFTVIKDSKTTPVTRHEWYLYDSKSKILTKEEDQLTLTTSFNVKADWLEQGNTYLLQGRAYTEEDETIDFNGVKDDKDLKLTSLGYTERYKYFIFQTQSKANYGLPGTFPYKLGSGGNIGNDLEIDNKE